MTDLRERMVAMTVRAGRGWGKDDRAYHQVLAIVSVQTCVCV